MDTNPIAARLYREDMRTTQPYVIQGHQPRSGQEHKPRSGQEQDIASQLAQVLRDIQATPPSSRAFREKQELYASLLETQRLSSVDAIAQNPYFTKYDVASNSKNIVRELRGAVSEDVTDRGIRESKKLLERNFDNRWIPQGDAHQKGLDSLEAYDLMRPKFTDMSKRYN
jgi:oligoendopeptidase F